MLARRHLIGLVTAVLLAALPVLGLPSGAAAETAGAQELEHRRSESAGERDRLRSEIALSEERVAELSAEIEALAKDHASLSAALVEAARAERRLAERVDGISARMDTLAEQQAYLRASLSARRGVLAEVLGALQRMGRNPPPAILVRPDDALSSVRSAILLGSVVPELRAETEVLIADLNELASVAAAIDAERLRLVAAMTGQAEEQQRVSLLLAEKRQLQARSQDQLEQERQRAEELASAAASLEELIVRLEADIEAARAAEQEAQRQREEAAAAAGRERPLPPADPGNVFSSLPFSALTGQVGLPVSGRILRQFGDDDGAGGSLMGDILRTHSGAIVTAPSDGSVLYAGPFRSYGQLLILNAGEGYHLVLAGMSRINVGLGQAVVAGEPVGAMGEARVANAAAPGEDAGPELYVEFRKEGRPVDPSPWWTRNSLRTGNDS